VARRFLVVLAHPLPESYAASVAKTVVETLRDRGYVADLLDLYQEDFDPRLSAAERSAYFNTPCDTSSVDPIIARLRAADGLILVFPQWWFNFPAILKGFFDRVFAPGVAFTHDLAGGRIKPALGNIRHLYAFTTTGSPWWMVKFYMGDPVRRLLKRGIAAFCAKDVDFRMLALHDMDRVSEAQLTAHLERVRALTARL
jgi:putative NADPH-quinone reductase